MFRLPLNVWSVDIIGLNCTSYFYVQIAPLMAWSVGLYGGSMNQVCTDTSNLSPPLMWIMAKKSMGRMGNTIQPFPTPFPTPPKVAHFLLFPISFMNENIIKN